MKARASRSKLPPRPSGYSELEIDEYFYYTSVRLIIIIIIIIIVIIIIIGLPWQVLDTYLPGLANYKTTNYYKATDLYQRNLVSFFKILRASGYITCTDSGCKPLDQVHQISSQAP